MQQPCPAPKAGCTITRHLLSPHDLQGDRHTVAGPQLVVCVTQPAVCSVGCAAAVTAEGAGRLLLLSPVVLSALSPSVVNVNVNA